MGQGIRLALVAIIACAGLSRNAIAAAQRTFVSPTGVDTASCSLAQPCRTFGAAIAQTSAGGEVVVLESAGYGSVTITQSVSIIAPPGVYAGISVVTALTNGVAVNGAGIDVVLRGLTIIALGGVNGTVGVNVVNARSVMVDRCNISGMTTYGIYSQSATQLTISNSEVRGSNTGVAANAGIVDIASSRILDSSQNGVSTNSGTRLRVDHTEIAGSGFFGVSVVSSNPGVITAATISQSRLMSNAADGISISALNAGFVEAALRDTVVSYNGNHGLNLFADAASTARVAGSRLTVNGNAFKGVSAGSAGVASQMVLTLSGSTVSVNGGDGVVAYTTDPAAVTSATLAGNRISANAGSGVISQNAGATISAHDNTITRNGTVGLFLFGGAINSDGTNVASENNSGDLSGGALGPLPKY